jgi:hypothetical protein
MNRVVALVTLALPAVAGAGGCKPSAGGGRLEAGWTGADTGAFAAPSAAEWCAAHRYVEIRASHNDTGVALALFPRDTVPAALPGEYRLAAAPADSSRPAAAVVVRWSDPASVSGFRGDSGTVVLRRGPDGRLAGEIAVSGPLLGGLPRRLKVTGGFRDLAVRPAARECPGLLSRPDSSDPGVDSGHGNADRDSNRADLLPQRIRPQGHRRGPPQRGLP